MATSDKELANTLAAIEKEFGKGSIMQLGDMPPTTMSRASPPGR